VDRDAVLDRVGGDEALLREIVGIFLDEYPSLVAEIRASVERQDAHALECAAHALKGSVSNFGAPSVAHAAFELELMGRRNELQLATDVFETLTSELIALHSALTHLATN
jgi:two-component system, sensor histidine kinase and response regulator